MLKPNKLRTLFSAVLLQISFEVSCALYFEVFNPKEIAVVWPEGKLLEFRLNVNRELVGNSGVDFETNKSTLPTELRIISDNLNVKKGDVLWYSGAFVDDISPYGEAGNYIFNGEYKPWHPPAGYRESMPDFPDLPRPRKLHKARREVTEEPSEGEEPKTEVIVSRFGRDRHPKHRHGPPGGPFPPPGPPNNHFAPPLTPPPFGHGKFQPFGFHNPHYSWGWPRVHNYFSPGDWRDDRDQRRDFRDQWRDYRDQWRDYRDQWRDYRHPWRGHGHHRDKFGERGPWDGHGHGTDKHGNNNGGNRLPEDHHTEGGSGVSNSNLSTTTEKVATESVTKKTTTTTDVPDIDIRFAAVDAE